MRPGRLWLQGPFLFMISAMIQHRSTAQDNCDGVCGRRPLAPSHGGQSRIIGGTDTLPGTWPWMVSFCKVKRVNYRDQFSHFCGGSLIGSRWILSAAHCFPPKTNITELRAVIGITNFAVPGPATRIVTVKQVINHKFYHRGNNNDISLIELSKPVQCSDYVQPACLPGQSVDVPNLPHCYISGWGVMNVTTKETSSILKEARVGLIPLETCNSSGWLQSLITPDCLCAGFEEGGVDTCQGDSGGPLMCRESRSERFWVVGVTSFGIGCGRAKKPGVYTSTQKFIDWITTQSGQDFYKPVQLPVVLTVPQPKPTTAVSRPHPPPQPQPPVYPQPQPRPTIRPPPRPTIRPPAQTWPQPTVRPQPQPQPRPPVYPQPQPRPTIRPPPQPTIRPPAQTWPQPTVRPQPQPRPRPPVYPQPQPTIRPPPQPTIRPPPQTWPQPTVRPRPQPRPPVYPWPQPRPTIRPRPQPTVRPPSQTWPQTTVMPQPQPGGQDDKCRGPCGRRPRAPSHGGPAQLAGTDALPGSWPWLVSIQLPEGDGFRHWCGGSLIGSRWVLTTAHCFVLKRFINVRYWRVLVGVTDLSKPGPDAQIFSIKMLAEHEQYSPRGQLNDIALIELNQSVTCNDYVQLACLPDDNVNMPALSHCYFSGWSTTDAKRYSKKPEILQEVKVNLLEVGACNSSRWYYKHIQDYNLCVMAEKGGKENCQGDGGAPLMCREGRSERFWVTGIDSWGSGCTRERMTEVFVSTKRFSSWIQRKTKEMLQPQRKPVVLQRPNWTRPWARPTPTPVKRPVTWHRPRPSLSWVYPNYVPMPPPKWNLPIGRPKGSFGSWSPWPSRPGFQQ